MNSLHFAGSDFCLDGDELDNDLLDALLDCGTPGQAADDSVAHVLETFTVSGDVLDCAAYLKGYGAWTAEELANHETNLERLVWLAGCSLREGEDVYFSTY